MDTVIEDGSQISTTVRKVRLTGGAAYLMEREHMLRGIRLKKRRFQRVENHGRYEIAQRQQSETIDGGTTMERTGADASDAGKQWVLDHPRGE